MKRVTALAAAISTCLLTSTLATAQDATQPSYGQSATTDGATRKQRTADASTMSRSTMNNAEFVKKAGAAGLAEVDVGKLGAQRATNPEVKAYAAKMVTDHTKGNKELTAAAKAKNLQVPSEPDLMHKAVKEKFEHQKTDADFDHDFMQHMVRDHEKVIELYQNAANDPNVDADLRAHANKTLPTLQEHLKEAQRLEAQLAAKQ